MRRVNLPSAVLSALLFGAALPASSWAYDSFRDEGGGAGCADCHTRDAVHDLHVGPITATCTLCHHTPGDIPQTWQSGAEGGQGCRGCHGVDNGTDFAWATGLRRHHVAAGVPADSDGRRCNTCHIGDPPSEPESTVPVYYLRSDVNVKFPCVSSGDGAEDFDGDGQGLDNDGDLAYDESDSDCQTGGTPDGRATQGTALSISPNPVLDGSVELQFRLSAPGNVSLSVFDIEGRAVYRHALPNMAAGLCTAILDRSAFPGGTLSAGIYTVRVEAGSETLTGRVIWLE